MKNKILLDLDGVLSDFINAAASFHKKDPSLVTCYGIEECWNIPRNKFWGPLGYDFWANLPLTQEAHTIVKMCENSVGQDNIGIFTSPCHTKGCTDGKRDWVAKHFPQFKRRCFTGKEKPFLASPHFLLIDDTEKQVDSFIEEGGWAFLFPRLWNRNKHLAEVALIELQRKLNFFVGK